MTTTESKPKPGAKFWSLIPVSPEAATDPTVDEAVAEMARSHDLGR
ncbi:hypothetical protein PJH60_23385 [Mycobacterium kansasii]